MIVAAYEYAAGSGWVQIGGDVILERSLHDDGARLLDAHGNEIAPPWQVWVRADGDTIFKLFALRAPLPTIPTRITASRIVDEEIDRLFGPPAEWGESAWTARDLLRVERLSARPTLPARLFA